MSDKFPPGFIEWARVVTQEVGYPLAFLKCDLSWMQPEPPKEEDK